MLRELAVGSAAMLATVLTSGVMAYVLELAMARAERWLLKPPWRPKLALVTTVTVLWALMTITMGVWLWALLYRALGVFPELEDAVYFSLTSFTTLGYGDVLLPDRWRLLGGLEAANGLLNAGLLTAVLVEVLRNVRLAQMDAARRHMQT